MRDDLFPLVAGGRVHRGLHHLEVDGTIQIGRDVELAIPVDHGIFIVGLARRNSAQSGVQLIGLEPVDFRCRVAGGADEDHLFAGALVDADEEAGVFLFIEERVFARRQVALVDSVGAGILVAVDPDNGLSVRRPFEAAIGIVDDGGGFRAGLDILNVDLVELAALRIGRIGDQLVVGAGVDAAEGEIVLAFPHRVAVEQDRLGGVGIEGIRSRAARDDRVFAALAVARVIGVWPVNLGHGAVVFLDAAAHFLEQFVAQRGCRVFEHGLGVGILGFEISADVGAQHGRVAHHLLPVVILHPLIGVVAGAVRLRDLIIDSGRDRRLGRGCGNGRGRGRVGECLVSHGASGQKGSRCCAGEEK